jgi:type II secretory pathway pseudopilin PulG
MANDRFRPFAARFQTGFTYLAVLALVAMLGAVAGVTAEVWHTVMQREKERQLLFVGQQFRLAIERYYQAGVGGNRHYPASLDDLIKDPRFPDTRRYLRRIWIDPITVKDDWGLVRGSDGGIVGVYSPSQEKPIKVANFTQEEGAFDGLEHYSEWVFSALPASQGGAATADQGAAQAAPGNQNQKSTDVFGSDIFGGSGAAGKAGP